MYYSSIPVCPSEDPILNDLMQVVHTHLASSSPAAVIRAVTVALVSVIGGYTQQSIQDIMLGISIAQMKKALKLAQAMLFPSPGKLPN